MLMHSRGRNGERQSMDLDATPRSVRVLINSSFDSAKNTSARKTSLRMPVPRLRKFFASRRSTSALRTASSATRRSAGRAASDLRRDWWLSLPEVQNHPHTTLIGCIRGLFQVLGPLLLTPQVLPRYGQPRATYAHAQPLDNTTGQIPPKERGHFSEKRTGPPALLLGLVGR